MAYKAKDVAHYMVFAADEMGEPISNLKLQKLLYFAWKEFYQQNQTQLFEESFEAWKFGPVVPEIYYEYCSYGPFPIDLPDFLQVDTSTAICENDKLFLREFLQRYRRHTVYELVQKTHEVGGAWSKVFSNGIGNRNVIPTALIVAECN